MAEHTVPIRFECEVTWDDLGDAHDSHAIRNGRKRRWFDDYGWRTYAVGFLMCAGAALLLFALLRTWIALLAGVAVFGYIGVSWAYKGATQSSTTLKKSWVEFTTSTMASNLVGRQELAFDQDGITRRTETAVAWRPWAAVSDLSEEAGGIAITIGTEFWLLPPSLFPGDRERGSLLRHLLRWKESADRPAMRIPEGELLSPEFDLHASHVSRASALGAPPWQPTPREMVRTGVDAFVAVGFWPWWERPVALIGLVAAFSALWRLVGSRLRDRWFSAKNTRRQLNDESVRAGFSGMTLGFGPEGLSEASPNSWELDTWPAIWEVVVNEDATFFRTTSARIYILPASAFPNSDAYFDFVEQALAYRRAALQGQAA